MVISVYVCVFVSTRAPLLEDGRKERIGQNNDRILSHGDAWSFVQKRKGVWFHRFGGVENRVSTSGETENPTTKTEPRIF